MVLNKQTFFVNLRKTPPNTFNVRRCHSPIRFIKVNPKTHAICHRSKCIYVACNRFAALVIELCDTKFFNVAFAVKAQLFFNCNFNWESVTIPTCFTDYLFAFHCVKAWKDILKHTSFNVVSTRHSISCWRAFIKCPSLCTGATCNRLFKDAISSPKIQDGVFHCWKIDLGWNWAKGHKRGSLFHAHA